MLRGLVALAAARGTRYVAGKMIAAPCRSSEVELENILRGAVL